MGQEALCTARFAGKVSRGKALLESDTLIFRGEFRLAIPFRAMKSVAAVKRELHIEFPGGVARFALGALAESWAHRILHPKSLMDKLGVKPGAVVAVLGVDEASFRQQLAERATEVAEGRPRKDSDLIFLAAEAKADLKRVMRLVRSVKKTGAVWVVYPKGQRHIAQADVREASKKAGLVDVKVVSFSATHTALKLVIPVERR